MLTIFTPTYNRAHTLPRLFASLQQQDNKDFEWLVADDGSTDDTEKLLAEWVEYDNGFPIRYHKLTHGGKQRAVNFGAAQSLGAYFFIVDSDDYLTPDAVSFILESFLHLPKDPSFIGISGLKCDPDGRPLGKGFCPPHGLWVDASNIERKEKGMKADMAEVFFTETLRQYPFPVWKGEDFTPEDVIWDKMALDGYRLRWFNKIIYICEYQRGGLSDSSWRLLRDNPMGFALLFDIKLRSAKKRKLRLSLLLNFISCCCLAGEWRFIKESSSPFGAFALFPAGFLLSQRRKRQIKRYLP